MATADDSVYRSRAEVGILVSSLVKPSIGYWWGRTGLRVSGMHWNEGHYEYHVNLGYALWDANNIQHGINLLTSWVAGSDPGADYRYASTGVAYSINYKGFFVELGLAHPWRDELGNLERETVIPCGYWGYLYRF
ncbi:hypothetical protein [Saccharospirillum salsuginis]|nr:hypothetical protein [Saccharospirillum salsuginis]